MRKRSQGPGGLGVVLLWLCHISGVFLGGAVERLVKDNAFPAQQKVETGDGTWELGSQLAPRRASYFFEIVS